MSVRQSGGGSFVPAYQSVTIGGFTLQLDGGSRLGLYAPNGAEMLMFSPNGLNVLLGATQLTLTSGAQILSGNGAPAVNTTKGSIYLRADGAVGSTLYVSQGGGVWNAVAGV